jgi:hypothetical protein
MSGPISRREFEELRRDVARFRQELAQRPLFGGGGGSSPRYELKILDGNTVYSSGGTTVYGINLASSIATVPSIYDPNGVGGTAGLFTAIDGIGRAQLWINGVLQSGFVLVVLDPRSPIPTLLAQLDSVRSEGTVSIPLVSDATQSINAYVPLFL